MKDLSLKFLLISISISIHGDFFYQSLEWIVIIGESAFLGQLIVVLLLGQFLGLGLHPPGNDKNWLAPGPKQLASFPGRFSCHMSFRLPFSNVAMLTQWSPSLHHRNP